jgi:hypothetical protein
MTLPIYIEILREECRKGGEKIQNNRDVGDTGNAYIEGRMTQLGKDNKAV